MENNINSQELQTKGNKQLNLKQHVCFLSTMWDKIQKWTLPKSDNRLQILRGFSVFLGKVLMSMITQIDKYD